MINAPRPRQYQWVQWLGMEAISFLRRHRLTLDIILSTAVFLYNLPLLPVYDPRPPQQCALLAISTTLCVAHIATTRYPRGAFAVIFLASCAQLICGVPLIIPNLFFLFAIYRLARLSTLIPSIVGAGLALVWLLVGTLPRLSDTHLSIGELGVLLLLVIWVWTWGTLSRIRGQYLQELRDRARRLENEREAYAQIAAARERTRIAREIHDIIAHSLSVVTVMSEGAAATLEDDPEQSRAAMLMVRDTGRSALLETRRLLGVLRSDEGAPPVPVPGISTVEALITQSREAGLPVVFRQSGPLSAIPPSLGATVYRIVQEGLTNARKHAVGASRVEVSISVEVSGAQASDSGAISRVITIRVTDNGRMPAAAESATDNPGHGLIGIRERAHAHGGTLSAGPLPSGGFDLLVTLPWDDHGDLEEESRDSQEGESP
ncbi:MAG: histidine kinase [Actinomycetaceae bacterium]|nr:histidine kinase [Actinomycetaceae bacterium]